MNCSRHRRAQGVSGTILAMPAHMPTDVTLSACFAQHNMSHISHMSQQTSSTLLPSNSTYSACTWRLMAGACFAQVTRADAPSWGRALASARLVNLCWQPSGWPCTIGLSQLNNKKLLCTSAHLLSSSSPAPLVGTPGVIWLTSQGRPADPGTVQEHHPRCQQSSCLQPPRRY